MLNGTLVTRDGRTAVCLSKRASKWAWTPYIIHGKRDKEDDLIVYYWPTGAAACPPDSCLDEAEFARQQSKESDELQKKRSAGKGYFL